MTKTYYRPIGFVRGTVAAELQARGAALSLAGTPVCFTQIELLRRDRATEVVAVKDWPCRDLLRERLTALRCQLGPLDLSSPKIMGIVNVTPDSFSDGGDLNSPNALKQRAKEMELQGANILDVGGESTRPGSELVSVDEELSRVIPAVKILSEETQLAISIDSRKSQIMEKAFEYGASIINDISALTFDKRSLRVAAQANCSVVLMHAQGDPKTMQDEPTYDDVLLDVYDYLEERVEACVAEGIDRKNCIVDPGIGFGKTLGHNLALLKGVSLFHAIGCPVMLGASRKSFIAKAGHDEPANERIGGSLASVLAGAEQGVQLFRVHDVAETAQALNIWQNVR